MLILTRRIGESIVIGEDVVVTVLRVKGGQVRLGVAAPAALRVRREELQGRAPPEATREGILTGGASHDGSPARGS
jgi:carbon storage regulator